MILAVASETVVRRTEQWFVRQGAPTMIEGYGFRSHVLPRMLPALTFVAVGSFAWLVLQQFTGLSRGVLLGVIVAVMVAAWVLLSVFVRRLPEFSPRATVLVLVVYGMIPVVTPLIQYALEIRFKAPDGDTDAEPVWGALAWFVVVFGLAFVATMLATTYGLGALLKAAIRHVI